MARRPFGGGPADFVVDTSSTDWVGIPATLTFWTAVSGGSPITDLQTSGGAPVTSIASAANGRVQQFFGPVDGTASMWADAGLGDRFLMLATDIPSRLTAVEGVSPAGGLVASNNLSDLTNLGAARTNLGLGSAATQPTSAFDAAGAATATKNETHAAGTGVVRSLTRTGDTNPWFVLTQDKRVFILDGNTPLATILASSDDWKDAKLVVQGNPAVGGVGPNVVAIVGGNPDGTNSHPLFSVADYLGAPIEQTMNYGGKRLNDLIQTMRSVFGPFWNTVDMYGYALQRGRASFVHPGPPGNALTHPTACGEVFDGTRFASIGTWDGYGAGLIEAIPDPLGFNVNPGESLTVQRYTQVSGTSFIARTAHDGTPGVTEAVPVAPGNVVRAVTSMAAAATTRTFTPLIQWLNSSGTQISGTITGTGVSVTAATWSKLTVTGTAPASAAYCLLHVTGTVAVGEIDYINGTGIWVDTRTSGAADPNPESAWSPPFTGQTDVSGNRTSVKTGDKYERTDVPATANKRSYVLDGVAGTLYTPRQVGAPGSTAQPRWLAVT